MTVDRLWIGVQSGNPVFRVSKEGVPVKTATGTSLLFDWQMKTLQKVAGGINYYSVPPTPIEYGRTEEISVPNIGYIGFAFVIAKRIDVGGFDWVTSISGVQLLQSQSTTSISVYVRSGNGVSTQTWQYNWFLLSASV